MIEKLNPNWRCSNGRADQARAPRIANQTTGYEGENLILIAGRNPRDTTVVRQRHAHRRASRMDAREHGIGGLRFGFGNINHGQGTLRTWSATGSLAAGVVVGISRTGLFIGDVQITTITREGESHR